MNKKVEPARQADALAAARAIFEDAKLRANRKNKVNNLDLLWLTLIEIREAGGRDYSLAEVGRRLEEKGGLKTQSLRNAGGADFREIVTAFAQSVMGSPRYIAKTKSSVDQALDFISDPSVRAVLKEEIARAKKLREENAMLRNAFSRLSIPTLVEAQGSVDPTPILTPVSPFTDNPALSMPKNEMMTSTTPGALSEELLKALQKGIGMASIRRNGFTIREDGSIWNAHYEIFPEGFVTACHEFTFQPFVSLFSGAH